MADVTSIPNLDPCCNSLLLLVFYSYAKLSRISYRVMLSMFQGHSLLLSYRIACLLSAISFTVLSSDSHAQSVASAVVDSIKSDEISKYPNGEWLIIRSDAFEHFIDSKVQEKLKLLDHELSGSISKHTDELLAKDTTLDVSNADLGQNETAVAISRTNSNLVVVAAQDDKMYELHMPYYVTTDAGNTWQSRRMPAMPVNGNALGDPEIAAAPDGTIYYGFLVGAPGLPVLIAKTIDGLNWSYCNLVPNYPTPGSADKEAMTVDNAPESPHFGRLYVVFTQFSPMNEEAKIVLSSSDDHGETWSNPTIVFDSFAHYSHVRTGTYGEVYVSFSSMYDTAAAPRHYFASSTDGGATFKVQQFAGYIEYPRRGVNWACQLKGVNGPRAFPYTTFQVDLSRNRIYMVSGSWRRWSNGDSSAVLYRTYSDDRGVSWQSALALGGNDNALHFDRFYPWVAYDQSKNKMSMFYYSSELDKTNLFTWPFYAELRENGSFGEKPLSNYSFDPRYCSGFGHPTFIGDYAGSDAANGKFAAAWTESREGAADGDVFASVIDETTNEIIVRKISSALQFSVRQESTTLRVNYQLANLSPVDLNLYDIRGVRVVTHSIVATNKSAEDQLDITALPSGTYIARISQSGESQNQKIEIVR